MLKQLDEAIEALVRRIGHDAWSLCGRIDSIADEDDFTSRLAQDIERSVNGRRIGGMRFTAYTKKLTWRGRRPEEPTLGADLLLVMRMHAGAFDVSKGYLVQAKMNVGSIDAIAVSKPRPLTQQLDAMLKVTSDSYIWAYSGEGVAVARAGTAKAAIDAGVLGDLKPQTLTGFFRSALRSHTGDYKLQARDRAEVAPLVEEYRARHVLMISGEAPELPRPTKARLTRPQG